MKKILLIMIGLSVGLMADFTRFSRDVNTGVVTDRMTGLKWQDNAIHYGTWNGAINYCEGLVLGGKNDWRLPNIRELNSLVDDTRFNPAISNVFLNTEDDYCWSSTTIAASSAAAKTIHFRYGNVAGVSKGDRRAFRCVRGGQSSVMPPF